MIDAAYLQLLTLQNVLSLIECANSQLQLECANSNKSLVEGVGLRDETK